MEKIDGLDKEALNVLVTQPARMMWDHEGVCTCGRRTYLFGQCFKCLSIDRAEDERERAEAELEEDFYKPPAEETGHSDAPANGSVSYTHLTLPTNREV
mgnify:CR=1 FL=1